MNSKPSFALFSICFFSQARNPPARCAINMSAVASIPHLPRPHGPAMHQHTTTPSTPSHFTPNAHHMQLQKQQEMQQRPQYNSSSQSKQSPEVSIHSIPRSISSSSSCCSSSPSLQQILLDQTSGPYSLEHFAEFLHSQFCDENLAFWLHSREYELHAHHVYNSIRETCPEFNLHQSSLQFLTQPQRRLFSELQSVMLIILDAYIQLDGPYELNLSDTVRSRLLKAVASGDYHPWVLDQAKDSITDLMKSSSYPLFLESALGKDIATSPSSSSPGSVFKRDSERDRSSWRKAMEQLKQLPRAMKKHTPS